MWWWCRWWRCRALPSCPPPSCSQVGGGGLPAASITPQADAPAPPFCLSCLLVRPGCSGGVSSPAAGGVHDGAALPAATHLGQHRHPRASQVSSNSPPACLSAYSLSPSSSTCAVLTLVVLHSCVHSPASTQRGGGSEPHQPPSKARAMRRALRTRSAVIAVDVTALRHRRCGV